MRTKKRNAPVGAGTPARARNENFVVNHSVSNLITSAGKSLHISELLQTGAENGVTLRELVAMTGMNERLVRLRIQQERKAGKLILSNNKDGYYLPECPGDVLRFARSMSRRAAEIASVARAAETALADMTGQECLEGWM